jgi:hypothetical protein
VRLSAFETGTPVSTRGVVASVAVETTRAGFSWGILRLHGISLDLIFHPRQWADSDAWRRAVLGVIVTAEGLLDARTSRPTVIVRTASWDRLAPGPGERMG